MFSISFVLFGLGAVKITGVMLKQDQLCMGRDPKSSIGLGTFLGRATNEKGYKLLVARFLTGL
jgi:hypothetical protein